MISSPALLTVHHDVSTFKSGEESLDEWLKLRALKNQENGASRTYVVTNTKEVVGYYALSVGSALHEEATSIVRRNMPNPVPVMIMGRLAVDLKFQRYGLGKALLKDAFLRTLQVADIVGVRAFLVHALHEKASQFYEKVGFKRSPIQPLTLMVTLSEIKKELSDYSPAFSA